MPRFLNLHLVVTFTSGSGNALAILARQRGTCVIGAVMMTYMKMSWNHIIGNLGSRDCHWHCWFPNRKLLL